MDLFARALPLWLAFVAGCRTSAATPQPAAQPLHQSEDLTAWVYPFMGTADGDSPDPPHGDKGGAVFPGATMPFGMIQWSPDTGPASEFGYHHADRRIKGFTVSHISGPGCPALLDFPFLPTTTAMSKTPVGQREATWLDFSHTDETASPGPLCRPLIVRSISRTDGKYQGGIRPHWISRATRGKRCEKCSFHKKTVIRHFST